MHDKILIVDFGSQVTQLIARRVREEGVYSNLPFQKAAEAFAAMSPRGVILSGRPPPSPRTSRRARRRRSSKPGCRRLASATANRRWRRSLVARSKAATIANSAAPKSRCARRRAVRRRLEKGQKYPVWMSHGDCVTRLPDGFEVIGISNNAPFAAIADEKRRSTACSSIPKWCTRPRAALLRNFLRGGRC